MQEHVLKQSEIIDNIDGYYSIELNDQGVFLKVYPPRGNGKQVNESTILEDLKNKAVNFQYAAVVKTIKEAKGIEVRIGDTPSPADEPEIQVNISRDRMEANLIIISSINAKSVTFEQVMEKLASTGVVFGLNTEEIHAAIRCPGKQTIAAAGQQPENGTNAYIKHYVDLHSKGIPTELENGKVDYRNLNMFTVVQQEELLAEKIPATKGIPGIDIFGNSIPAKAGKDILMPVGKNVHIIEDTKIIATQAGQMIISNNKLHVLPVIEIKGDVDLSTGNIDFIGSVIVRGSVQSGFCVKAAGNVEIYGTVSGGTVEGKNVIIKTGVQGMNRGYIKASENVVSKFIENAIVFSDNDVIVSEAIFHSKVNAAKKVLVQGKRGLIAGGIVIAGEEIVAKMAGTQMATATELEVGINPAMREEYQAIRKEVKQMETNLEQTQKAITLLKSMDQASMPADKRDLLLKLTKTQFHLVGRIESIRNRIAEIEIEFDEMKNGRIRIADILYPGVKIVVGAAIKPIREQLSYVSFFSEDGDIKVGSFN